MVPELIIAPMQTARKALIVQLDWGGMRIRVRADGGDGVFVDLRLGAEGEGASIGGAPRPLTQKDEPRWWSRTIRWRGRPHCWSCAMQAVAWWRARRPRWEAEQCNLMTLIAPERMPSAG